ncbi:MAG: prenyltransferase/squalene oxidase repeat-containing protein [Candidatus Sumerlaeia bacterium]
MSDNDMQGLLDRLCRRLFARMAPGGWWEGRLSSSALSTAVTAYALAQVDQNLHAPHIQRALSWLQHNQNRDGGWGDTPDSPSNLSTTMLCRCALTVDEEGFKACVKKAEGYIAARAGGTDPDSIARYVLKFYGKDLTFSAPILTMCALSGVLGPESGAWKYVPQLPFEFSIFPHRMFQYLRLQVVSYAIPALVAVGLVRHRHRPSWNPVARIARTLATRKALSVAQRCQPDSGGFLEASPLTAFVTMCLCRSGHREHPIVKRATEFLIASIRDDGSLPIDTNLATWVTTLSVNSLPEERMEHLNTDAIRRWLLDQQHRVEHPFTHAEPGGWAWTDLSGGVPDADDTSGALLALKRLSYGDSASIDAAREGIEWLLGLQNSDGGIPTFCRGWGKLPFDQSCPDLTAHALQAWDEWRGDMTGNLKDRIQAASFRARQYLERVQVADGSWLPRWFGNQQNEDHGNPVYGTAQVLKSLVRVTQGGDSEALRRGAEYLVSAQNEDGGWGGRKDLPSTIEETALAVAGLASCRNVDAHESIRRGVEWLEQCESHHPDLPSAPIGLYFASLWYDERLYPVIFSIQAVSLAQKALAD